GATDPHGRVLIDSGLLFWDASATRRLCALAGCPAAAGHSHRPPLHERHGIALDLYEQMTAAMTPGRGRSAFVGTGPAAGLRRDLWTALHTLPLRAMEVGGE